jgi:hypothetical protein
MKASKLVFPSALLLAAPYATIGQFSPYYTSVDVYLDPSTSGGADLDDTRWELSSAASKINGGKCEHLRDFIFTCGWYAADGTDPNRWICSASNNSVGWPQNPAKNPYTLPNVAAWYTFQHSFSVVGGQLSVKMEIVDSSGSTLQTWTLSDPSDVESILGGNRYGWFVRLGCRNPSGADCSDVDSSFKLPIDNTQKCTQGEACEFFQGFEDDTSDWFGLGGPPPSQIVRVGAGTNGISSASGNNHALVYPAVAGSTFGTGTFTQWGGYCRAVFTSNEPSAVPSTAPSLAPSTEPCIASCNVPLEVSGICDLEVLLDCDDDGNTGPDVTAKLRCDCAEGVATSGSDDENFCIYLKVGDCTASLETIGTSGTVECVIDGATYTFIASVPKKGKSKSKSKSKSKRALKGKAPKKGKGKKSQEAEKCEL